MKEWFQDNKTEVIIGVIILVLFFFVVRSVYKKPGSVKKRLLPGEIGGEIPTNWYPDDVTDKLKDALSGGAAYNVKSEAVAASVNALNDNQIIMIYNDWDDRFSQEETWWGKVWGSLTQMVRDEWYKGKEMIKFEGRLETLKLP